MIAATLILSVATKAQCSFTIDVNKDQRISLSQGHDLTKEYRDNHDGIVVQNVFTKSEMSALFAQTNCVAVRLYNAEKSGTFQLVAVGVDICGNDLTNGIILDRSTCPCINICPCSNSNALNTD